MHDDARDRAAIFQSDVLPRAAAIGGAVHAVAPTRGIAIVRLARPDPEHIGIRRRDGDGADRLHRFLVEDRIERDAIVAALEEAAGRESDVEERRIS